MALIQVRDVPDAELTELKARAAAEGQSLNSYMRELIHRETATPTVAQVLQRAADRSQRASDPAVEALDAARAERDAEIASSPPHDPAPA